MTTRGSVKGEQRAPGLEGHPTHVGHYVILELLGSGVLSYVYRAELEGLGRPVVIKVLRSTSGPESSFHRRFAREARLLAGLRHPNLIELFDYDDGVVGERPPHMVLELVLGASLADLLKATGRLQAETAAVVGLEVARALAYAHTHGVVHRDVKPGNVLVGRAGTTDAPATRRTGVPGDPIPEPHTPSPKAGSPLGGFTTGASKTTASRVPPMDTRISGVARVGAANESTGRTNEPRQELVSPERELDEGLAVKLVDFGIARERTVVDPDDEGVGTPAYMAPEQLLGEPSDGRADQWALGVVMFQMLTGVRPFDGDDGRPVIQRVRRDPPRTFKSLGISVPRELERLVLRCLAKRPTDRYANTQELVQELARFLETRLGAPPEPAVVAPMLRRLLARGGVVEERKVLREETARSPGGSTSSRDTRVVRMAALQPRAIPLLPALLGMGVCLLAMVAGGFAIQLRERRNNPRPATDRHAIALEGEVAGRLKVVVFPWAEVFVDGERVDVTPIGKPLRVKPGRHIVLLVHPASSQRRVVDIPANTLVNLDVTLDVPEPSTLDEYAPASPSASVSASSASAAPSKKGGS